MWSGALLFMLVLAPSALARKCFNQEIHGNVTFHLMPHCQRNGVRDFRYSLNPGNYSCRAFNGAQLTIPRFEGDYVCARACPGGHSLGLGVPPR